MSSGVLTLEMLEKGFQKMMQNNFSVPRVVPIYVNLDMYNYLEKINTLKGEALIQFERVYRQQQLKKKLQYTTKQTKKRLPLP